MSATHAESTLVPDDESRPQIDNISPLLYENHLTPPAGTLFFSKSQAIAIFENEDIKHRNVLGQTIRYETLTWRSDVYKYVTNAKPDDPDFQRRGGEIFVIFVHPVKHYPATGSGIQSGENWTHKIGFKQTMSMFNHGGNGILDFQASYMEDFVRTKSQQRGSELTNGVEFSVHFEPDVFGQWPVIGFSVFKCLDPSAFPVTFTFEASAGRRVGDTVRIITTLSLSPNNTRPVSLQRLNN
ncbi:hypothetical protein PLEOSDRAFT_158972 [Pleurotus ostreatus PC15]|uniref:Uncharacterized protein n=1 Tax=Pleurotus ostreatus (strain PC15) TaxID=1137138 RepID=A0A067NGX1_PLEO1|nr:hypothetical protein PLEOSDRAFT_158972 [Pleurotus ostreatus PC15]